MTASPYLLRPAKPEPDLLPGDLKVDARGIYRCFHICWGGGHWIYWLEAL